VLEAGQAAATSLGALLNANTSRSVTSSLREEVAAWIALDPDENDRRTLQELLELGRRW